ncbi:MAG TPA: CDP-alcohol phosphatidyltransferase family protein [Chitinophagaceae bacterium]|nr:CDP-alcohol phosphatidyltransferase family protein [Chitinophagaceae bacterium]
MKQLPNLFTVLNLVFGCIAIIFILQNGIAIYTDAATGTQLIDIPEKIWLASLFIGMAALVDFLDGFVARLFNSQSAMGRELDSLADIVSFGVAPGLIIYQFLRLSYAHGPDGLNTSMIWLVPALLLPCAAAWRLAKFNLDTSGGAYSFKGMPVPAVGLFIASLPLVYWNVNEAWAINLLVNKWVLYGIVILFSFLMTSSIPFISLKFRNVNVKKNLPQFLLIGMAILSVVIFQWLAGPVIILAYILVSLIFKNKMA